MLHSAVWTTQFRFNGDILQFKLGTTNSSADTLKTVIKFSSAKLEAESESNFSVIS